MKDNNSSGVESQQTGVIYLITNTLNGKMCVGQTRQKLSRRITGHKSSRKKYGIDAAIKKYGWENFTVEVLETCPVEMLNEREIFWIAKLNSKVPNGYNLTDGGDGGSNPSEETRAKMSAAKKGRPAYNKGQKMSEEQKAKISANHADCTGKRNSFYGKHHSEEARARMSAAKKGKSHKPRSQETRAKISAVHKGKKVSEETRAKISASEKGKHVSEETRARMSAAHKGKSHKPHSPETRAKLSAAGKRRKHSEETRAKMSVSQKARWARRKKAVESLGDS